MALRLKNPTPSLVKEYITRFEQDPAGYSMVDRALSELFRAFPRNQSLEDVLIKVAALNSLYNTYIFATYEVAKHISGLNIDPKLDQKSWALVEEIAEVKIGGKSRRNYSFATKYCSWHAPDAYPIYDGFVDQLIWAYKREEGFAVFHRRELWDNYPRYAEIIDGFRDYYGLSQFSFKQLDKFLWLYAKEVFP